MTKLLDKIGDLNPQLFRELKGKFTFRNTVLTAVISFISQLLLCLVFASQIAVEEGQKTYSPYVNWDELGNWTINWQLWSFDLFISLSLIGIFALIVLGTYMLISDLSEEEKRGTLNFVRLSPQSARSILIGKLLGVPALLFFAGAIALPLNLASGLAAQIPLASLLGFYAVLGASCLFFYSAALLFSLASFWAKGLQPWLGSGVVLFTLGLWSIAGLEGHFFRNFADFFLLFSPATAIRYLVPAEIAGNSIFSLSGSGFNDFTWYGLPVWKMSGIGMGLMVGNCTLWSYWLWQGLQRRFHNPQATIWSKAQTYFISLSFMAVSLGLIFKYYRYSSLDDNIDLFLFFLILLSVGFIAAAAPHRQNLQDWARYRHQNEVKRRTLLRDLLLGEKSPGTVAIALNLGIITLFLLLAIAFFPISPTTRTDTLFSILLTASLILVYASIVQRMLLMKTKKRAIWATATIVALFALYPMAVGLLTHSGDTFLWLFSPAAAFAVRDIGIGASIAALCLDWLAIALLHADMSTQLHALGASESKRFLARS